MRAIDAGGDEHRPTLHERLHALTMFLVSLQEEGFFDSRHVPHDDEFGWRGPAQVATVALRSALRHLESEIGEREYFDCYSDGMLGYTVAEIISGTFAYCAEWGEEGRDARHEILVLLLHYWRIVCSVDSPSPAMDLNKRIASAIGSVIDGDRDLAEWALDVANDAHETIIAELRANRHEASS